MKKFFALTIALMMVFTLGVFAADYEVDISSITDFTNGCVFVHEGAQFDGVTINFLNNDGPKACLGDLNLADYSKVIVYYGSDPAAYYDISDNVFLQDAEGNKIGSFQPSVPYGFWGQAIRESEIEISSDYSGLVYLVSGLSSHGISISGVTFVEKTEGDNAPATDVATEAPATNAPATNAATEAPATNAPATNAPATNAPATNASTDASTKAPAATNSDDKADDGKSSPVLPIIIIIAVVAVAAVVAVVLVKKSKK